MSNLFDEQEGQALTMKALKILEKPPEIQKEDDPFLVNASLATEFIMVRDVEEYREGKGIAFKPDYMHQVFRESNEVYGYKDLRIRVYLTSVRLVPLIKWDYSEVCEDADDIEKDLLQLYESGYHKMSEEQHFLKVLEEEAQVKPVGELIKSEGKLEIYKQSIATKGFAELKANLQAFLKILIDGAQYPCDSEYWVYYTVYEKDKRDAPLGYSFVGLCTLYIFNLSLNHARYRISQMLFLPSHQRKGNGGTLLLAVYEDLQRDQRCFQITLEDPSEDFQVMRDITDIKLLAKEFPELLRLDVITSPQQLDRFKLDKNHLKQLMRKTKLYGQQIRRCHQIMLYSRLDKYLLNHYLLRTSKPTMVAFGDYLLSSLKRNYSFYERAKCPLVVYEDGSTLNPRQLDLLTKKEREDKKQLNLEEVIIEEFSFFEIISQKLRKDKVL